MLFAKYQTCYMVACPKDSDTDLCDKIVTKLTTQGSVTIFLCHDCISLNKSDNPIKFITDNS